MSNNRYELNPALHRDMPQDLFEDKGTLPVIFFKQDNTMLNCLLPFECNGVDFTVDCSVVKSEWVEEFMDDLISSIDLRYKQCFFLSRKDLNLNIIGI